MSSARLGVRLARERLRGVAPLLVAVFAAALTYALSAFNRGTDGFEAADGALEGPVFGLIVPILAYFLVERVCDSQRLDHAVDAIARYGADRRHVVVGLLLSSALLLALFSVVLTWLGLFAAHGGFGHDFFSDARASTGVAFLAGAVYVPWFGFASLFGPRGGGRKWALGCDFVLGAGSSALGSPCPRGHIRNLLGGSPALDLSQHGAWFALLLIGALSLALSAIRERN